MRTITILFASLMSLSVFAQSPSTPMGSPDEKLPHAKPEAVTSETMGAIKKAKVYFIEPKDGATVPKTFTVKMGVEGIKIRPAGEDPDDMTSGHHHLIIDGKPLPAGTPIPTDEKHQHFGKGQTEATVTLSPGKHTLILQFADGAHRSFGPKLMQKIQVTVK